MRKRSMQSEISERCEQMRKQKSEWPLTLRVDFISILPNVRWSLLVIDQTSRDAVTRIQDLDAAQRKRSDRSVTNPLPRSKT